ncbi:MAG: 30S ribosomal protein S5 [Limisphaerales bacterium]
MSEPNPNLPEAGAELTTAAPPAERGEQRGGERGGRGRGPGRSGPRRRPEPEQATDSEFSEKVIFINRSAKVVMGGRRFSFSALVVTGDRKGKIGIGLGKAAEVSEAIKKGGEASKQNMLSVSITGATIPHDAYCTLDGAKVLLRPASPGTGLIAGKTVRAVLETVGIKDVLSKSLGSKNAANVAKATIAALQSLRLREDVAKRRGVSLGGARKEAGAPAAPVAA